MRPTTRIGAISLIMLGLTACTTPAPSDIEAVHNDSTAEHKNYAKAFDMQRCVNIGNSFEAPIGAPWGKKVQPEEFSVIKSKGFDTVRIPARWSDYLGPAPNYRIAPDFMETINEAVSAALDADLNVILNMHHNEDIVEVPGPAIPAYLAAWRQIAEHFKDAPDDLWFELLNEPYKNLNGSALARVQSEGVAVVRVSNPERIIILGGEEWSGIRTLDTNIAPPDENIVYTFHYYDPFNFTHQEAGWLGDAMPKGKRGWGNANDRAELRTAGDTAVDYRARIRRPVFLGEFGAHSPIANRQRVKWAGAVRAEFESRDIPWCLWSYSNTFALYDNETGIWDKNMLGALGVARD